MKVSMDAAVLFDTAKHDLKPEAVKTLISVVEFLQTTYKNRKLMVSGHTDSVGSLVYNQGLSERRANSVKNFLSENGIESERMYAVGYGKTMPIATNSTVEGRAKNRRVDIIILKENFNQEKQGFESGEGNSSN
jgi:OOP family OmpA-OmpF porin